MGAYGDVRKRIMDKESRYKSIQDKIPRIVWRGNDETNPPIRGALLNATKGKKWADVERLDWGTKSNILAMENHCDYAYVAHTEGRSYSGRAKYLLNCASVSITHEPLWDEMHRAAMHCASWFPQNELEWEDWEDENPSDFNCVQVEDDWSDLEEKISFLEEHPSIKQMIADNAVTQFRERYVTPAAEACFWRALINGYASVLESPPDMYEENEKGEIVMRGLAFESFIVMGTEPFSMFTNHTLVESPARERKYKQKQEEQEKKMAKGKGNN